MEAQHYVSKIVQIEKGGSRNGYQDFGNKIPITLLPDVGFLTGSSLYRPPERAIPPFEQRPGPFGGFA
jgi:hypothetical protein